MSELLTLEEAAAKVKVKPRTVLDWLQKGKLDGVKVGKQWRVPAEHLEAFIRPATAEPFHLREPEEAAPTEQAAPGGLHSYPTRPGQDIVARGQASLPARQGYH